MLSIRSKRRASNSDETQFSFVHGRKIVVAHREENVRKQSAEKKQKEKLVVRSLEEAEVSRVTSDEQTFFFHLYPLY